MKDFGPLGENPEQHILEDSSGLLDAVDALLHQTRRSVRIHAPDLDPALLNRDAPLTALARLTRSRGARVRVLFQDAGRAMRQGHRLIELSRKFPTFIELRRMDPEDRDRQDAWLVADETGLVYRPDANRLAYGHACFQDPSMAPKLARDFDEWWERAAPDPELRRLFI